VQVDVPGMENESDRYLILYKMIYTFMFYVMVSLPPFSNPDSDFSRLLSPTPLEREFFLDNLLV